MSASPIMGDIRPAASASTASAPTWTAPFAAAAKEAAALAALTKRVEVLEAAERLRKEIECRGTAGSQSDSVQASSSASSSPSTSPPRSPSRSPTPGADPWALGYFYSRVAEDCDRPLSDTLREFARRVRSRANAMGHLSEDQVNAELRAAIGDHE